MVGSVRGCSWVLACMWLVACSEKAADNAGAGGGAGNAAVAGSSSGAGAASQAGASGSAGTGGAHQGGNGAESGAPASAGEGGASGADSGTLKAEEVLAQYRSWGARGEPQNVSGYIFGLCRLPTLPEQTFADSEHGNQRYLQDWVNPAASAGFAASGKPAFPVGSVIVKEKYTFVDDDAELDLVAIGMMIKRSEGFAPAHADWDYAYYEPDLGILQTSEQSSYCADCHAAAADTDHVYVLGLTPGSEQ